MNRSLKRSLPLRFLCAAALALMAAVLAPSSIASATGSVGGLSAPPAVKSVLGWGFYYPLGIGSDGTHVWVVNSGGNSVTELSASTGALVKVISGSSFKFNDPSAIALGRHPRLGGELRWPVGDRAHRIDGSVRQGGSRGRTSGSTAPMPSPRTAPTSGWRTRTATRSPS